MNPNPLIDVLEAAIGGVDSDFAFPYDERCDQCLRRGSDRWMIRNRMRSIS